MTHFKDKDQYERAKMNLSFPINNSKNYTYDYPESFDGINISDLITTLEEYRELGYDTITIKISKYAANKKMRGELIVREGRAGSYLLVTDHELTPLGKSLVSAKL